LGKAWQYAVINLVGWFEEAEDLAKKYFGRFPTEEYFPQKCPYTFEQVMEHRVPLCMDKYPYISPF